jgi:tetratricopeptide (TPR) repeat protein
MLPLYRHIPRASFFALLLSGGLLVSALAGMRQTIAKTAPAVLNSPANPWRDPGQPETGSRLAFAPSQPQAQPQAQPSLTAITQGLEQGQYQSVKQSLQAWLKVQPDAIEALDYLFITQTLQQDNKAALATSADRLYRSPMARSAELPSPEVFRAFQQAAIQQQRQAPAQLLALQAEVAANPKAIAPRLQRLALLRDQATPAALKQAIAEAKILIQLQPKDGRLHQVLGSLLMLGNQKQAALQAFDKALKLAPKDAGIKLNRAIVLQNVGQAKAAITAYSQLIQHNPKNWQAYQAMASAYERQNQPLEALAVLHRGWQAQPDGQLLPALQMSLVRNPDRQVLDEVQAYLQQQPDAALFSHRAFVQAMNKTLR